MITDLLIYGLTVAVAMLLIVGAWVNRRRFK